MIFSITAALVAVVLLSSAEVAQAKSQRCETVKIHGEPWELDSKGVSCQTASDVIELFLTHHGRKEYVKGLPGVRLIGGTWLCANIGHGTGVTILLCRSHGREVDFEPRISLEGK